MRCFAITTVAGLCAGLCLLGCGSSVVQEEPGTGGAGGATSASTVDTTTGVGGNGPLCARTNDGLSLAVNTWDGLTLGCGSGFAETQGTFEYSAALSYDGNGQITLDSCPPNADCLPQISTVRFEAKGLQPYLPSGLYVKLIVTTNQPMGCEHSFFVLNLPEWGGVPNPVTIERKLWLAGVDGTLSLPPGLPYAVEKRLPTCVSPDATQDYLLAFTSNDDPTKSVEVEMGQTKAMAQGPGGTWIINNLRSYDSGAPDDFWNWAYWIAQPYPPD